MAFTLIIAILCVVLLLASSHGLFRQIYLASKIRGPSLWEVLTVYSKDLLSSEMATGVYKISKSFDFKPWGIWTFDGFNLFVSDSESVSEVLKNKNLLDKPNIFYAPATRFLGKGLLTMNGPMYYVHRKIDNLLFRKAVIDAQLPKMNQEISKLVERLAEVADGRTVDVRTYVEDHIAASSLRSISSDRFHISELLPIFHNARKVFESVHIQSVNPLYYWLVHHLKPSTRKSESIMEAYLEKIRALVDDEKTFALKRINAPDVDDISPMEVWVRAWVQMFGVDNIDEPGFAEARILLIASFDTTSFATNTTLLLLALHPEAQQRVFEEVQNIVGDEDRPVLAEDLSKMEYLDWVIKESLRLFPPGTMLPRRVNEELTIGGVLVPKGSSVVCNVIALHRNPDVFEDPLKFDPARFSPECSWNRHPLAFIPFSASTRCCPGQYLANTLMKMTISSIVRKFKILPGEGLDSIDDIKFKMEFTTHLSSSSLAFLKRDV